MFDKIVDLNSYIDWCLMSSKQRETNTLERLSPEALGCKAYFDENFDFVKEFFEKDRERYIQDRLEQGSPCDLEDYENRIMAPYRVVKEWMAENDVSWVPEYIASQTKFIKDKFLSQYSKLKVFWKE